jgi:hypothetical protein
VQEGR